jgi:hypothetical protein
MKSYLLPLLQKYNVDAYICGHDHISEILKYQNQLYVVAGAGSQTDYYKASSTAATVWYGAGYSAFGTVEATTTYLKFSFVDTSGNTKYAYSVYPKVRSAPPTRYPSPSPSYQPTSQPTRIPKSVGLTVGLSVAGGFVGLGLLALVAFRLGGSQWSYMGAAAGRARSKPWLPFTRPGRLQVVPTDPPLIVLSSATATAAAAAATAHGGVLPFPAYTSARGPYDYPRPTHNRTATEVADSGDNQGAKNDKFSRRTQTTLY